MPSLINQPRKKVAVDLVRSITPANGKGQRRFDLSGLCNKVSRSCAMKIIDMEMVAEALFDINSREGIPKEVLSDLGTQFTS